MNKILTKKQTGKQTGAEKLTGDGESGNSFRTGKTTGLTSFADLNIGGVSLDNCSECKQAGACLAH